LLFEVFSQRDERGSTLVTGNLPFDEWAEILGVNGSRARCSIGSPSTSTSLA
jgi:hypothetical protein